ncbi:hypothetical protein MMJ63_23870, partial [Bacillus vallismortis]|nr:hypothetical protein [Bacillus vallismortis]
PPALARPSQRAPPHTPPPHMAHVEPVGRLPNGLYDQRDVLIDKFSSMVDIKRSYNKSGGTALASADGTVSSEISDNYKQSRG